jgi:hypothetical protein
MISVFFEGTSSSRDFFKYSKVRNSESSFINEIYLN